MTAVVESQTLGEQLRELRLQRGLTLREVARLVDDLSWQGLSKVERGERTPSTQTLAAIARALGVSFVVDAGGARLERS